MASGGPSAGIYQRAVAQQQQQQQQLHVLNDNNYPKKSYNYMASPNYLQFENTYQKNKKICHSKDVTNFRDSNSHCGGTNSSNLKQIQQQQQQQHHQQSYLHQSAYYDEDMGDDDDDDEMQPGNASTSMAKHGDNANSKCINTVATLSSDDEGGFRRDVYNIKNHFTHDNNGNSHYSTKEVEPLLQVNSNKDLGPITKVMKNCVLSVGICVMLCDCFDNFR